MSDAKPIRKAAEPDAFTKWLRSGGLFQRMLKESIITTPIVAVMVVYGFFKYSSRVDFSWPMYLGTTALISTALALYFAIASLRKFPEQKAVLDPTAPEFGAPIEPE